MVGRSWGPLGRKLALDGARKRHLASSFGILTVLAGLKYTCSPNFWISGNDGFALIRWREVL